MCPHPLEKQLDIAIDALCTLGVFYLYSMASVEKAAQILKEAERELRDLLGKAAGEGDYEGVLQVAACAKRVGELLSELTVHSPDLGAGAVLSASVAGAGATSVSTAAVEPARKGAGIKPVKWRPGRAAYPQFFRNGDVLVKIAWSKTNKGEYEHKAQFGVVRDLITAIRHAASKNGRFAMESLLPLRSSAGGQEVPSYQTYLCLAWLRAQGLVVQHGRQGYSINPKVDILAKAQEMFEMLPERQFTDSSHQ